MATAPLIQYDELLTFESIQDFLDAYPCLTSKGDSGEMYVDFDHDNFVLEFSPFRMNGEEIEIGSFVQRVAQGDFTVFVDWNIHATVYIYALNQEKENPMEFVGDTLHPAIIQLVFDSLFNYISYVSRGDFSTRMMGEFELRWNENKMAFDVFRMVA